MSGLSHASDINIVDPRNSFTGNLTPNQAFTGTFVDVSDFTTITFTAMGDIPPATTAIQFQWSEDGVTTHSTTDFGSDAVNTQTCHATIRTKFWRVRYTASSFGQTNARLQTLLRKGNIAGGVSRVGLITGSPDAQIINGVLFAKNQNGNFVAVQTTNDPFLIVAPSPAGTSVLRIVTNASLTSVQVDFAGIGAPTRRWADLYNNTTRGNLHIRLGAAATLTNYDYKIPPQHTWEMPLSWPPYKGTGATVFGIWDVADGQARWTEGI